MRLRLLLLPLLLCVALPAAYANHIIGGVITYECLGPDAANPGNQLYRFTMRLYRDCLCTDCADFDGIFDNMTPPLNDAFVTIWDDGNLINPIEVVRLNIHRDSIDLVDPTDNAPPCVIIPPGLCIQEGKYEFERSLPIINDSYIIAYQRCCRNEGITNIINSGNTGSTFSVEITPFAQQICNSSPAFDEYPPALICVDEDFNYNAAATDADGDQLVYSLCAPVQGGTPMNPQPFVSPPPPYTDVNYVVPQYSPTAPMGGNPIVTINPTTGIMTGIPNTLGKFVVGICVREFRNGQLLSTVQRDFQFSVTTCDKPARAVVDAQIKDGKFFYQICNGESLTIENESTSTNTTISKYEWDFTLSDGSMLEFDTRDINLPMLDTGIHEGRLVVFPENQIDNFCTDTINFTILVTPDMFPDFEFVYDTCVAGPVEFMDLSDTLEAPTAIRRWTFGDGVGMTEGVISPAYRYQNAGQYTTELFLQDTFGCDHSISKQINWQPAPPILVVKPNRFKGCTPLNTIFENLSSPIDETYELFWTFGDSATSTEISPSHVYVDTGRFTVSLSVVSPIGCKIDTVFKDLINVFKPPVADFTFTPDSATSLKPEISFIDASSPDTRYWYWDIDGEVLTYDQNPMHAFQDTGIQVIRLEVANQNFCYDTIFKTVDVVPEARFFLPNAFSPNNDGLNDEFIPTGIYLGVYDYELTVWDRYGEPVFNTTELSEGWNGRKNNSGRLLTTGVYVYRGKLTEPRGKMRTFEGFVTLVR